MERSTAPEAPDECGHCCDGQQDGTNGVGDLAHDREYQKGYVSQEST